jgi:hypothetical protein
MSADFSRQRFDPLKDFCGVLMQQGRVQLDGDWNELVELLDRRLRAETADVIGRCTVPRLTPNGFLINLSGGQLTIGPGRIYVDGLLAENHGLVAKKGPEYDPVLAELRGTDPVPYDRQRYFPGAPPLPGPKDPPGPYLVYIDVWQRQVTFVEDPDLVENALGVDTTARLQTAWQVKLFGPITGLSCGTPDDQIPGWAALTAPSAARLTTSASTVPSPTDPCVLPPVGGYRGLENQLYRVEIHSPGDNTHPPTFKWSRDNASVVTPVTVINPTRDVLTVVRTGRDPILRVNAGDWVEVTDDYLEFAGKPGILRKVKDVNDDTRTITLASGLPDHTFPTDANGKVDSSRHTRLYRWDQKGKVFDTNNQLVVDLDAPGSTGEIPVPAAPATIVLENGVQIAFSTDPAGGNFRVGDYWVFAARTADASVEPLDHAPPRGPHHHFGRLAVVTFPGTASDCRVPWPPDTGGPGCDCTVCVTAESHNNGTLTIQKAIDRVTEAGGRVCLEPGTYHFGPESLRINGGSDVRLSGHGQITTVLLYSGPGPAIAAESSTDVTLEDFQLLTSASSPTITASGSLGVVGVLLSDAGAVTVQRCQIGEGGQNTQGISSSVAVGLANSVIQATIRECVLSGGVAIANVAQGEDAYLWVDALLVRDNILSGSLAGVRLDGFTTHYDGTWIVKNIIDSYSDAGIILTGAVNRDSGVDVKDNYLSGSGDGIRVGTSATRLSNNDVTSAGGKTPSDGIVLAAGLESPGLARCQVIGNRIGPVSGTGISLRTHVVSAVIARNDIESTGDGGIVMEDTSRADELNISDNRLQNLGVKPSNQLPLAGIQIFRAAQAMVASNLISTIATVQPPNPQLAGILVVASSVVRIAGNEIVGVGPPESFPGAGYGIRVRTTFDQLEVVENLVRRGLGKSEERFRTTWYAVLIEGAVGDTFREPSLALIPLEGDNTVGYFGLQFLQLGPGGENLSVRGNRFESAGSTPAVRVNVRGSCVFTENQCVREYSSPEGASVVTLAAGAIVAGNNVVKLVVGKEREGGTLVLILNARLGTAFTVLGNLVNGGIQVNGAALGAPWNGLNITTPLP